MRLLSVSTITRNLLLALIPLIVLCLPVGLVFGQPASEDEPRRIREIRVHIANVYPEEKAKESSWAASVNKYHMKTRETVIRNEILFKEGDILDEELIKESERKLRRFRFINKAKIEVVPVDNRSVDVEVHTRDAWSLVPGVDFEGGGGLAKITPLLTELNLLGYGKTAFLEGIYESDVGWTSKLGYRDYQLFNSRWIGSASYKSGPLVESYFVQAQKPLYSIDAKWSYGGYAYSADKIVRRFAEGEESSRFAKEQISAGGFLKRSFGERFKKTNVKLKLDYNKADYASLGAATTEPPPPDKDNVTPLIGITHEDVSFAKYTFVNKMGSTEDTWLGQDYGAHVGYGIPVEDGFELWDVGGYYAQNMEFKHKQLLKTIMDINTEVVRNTILAANAKYYKKFSKHTVATRAVANLGWDLDSSRQFTLGADSGLRGYPARQYTGERLMLINLEDRQFWGKHALGIEFDLGTVLFVDAGNVWKEEAAIELTDLNWSVGGGLRLGLSNMPGQPIIRMDVGAAFNDPEGFAVTIGHEQHF